MKAKKIKYYLFNELSERSKQKAINDFIKDQNADFKADFPDLINEPEISVYDVIDVFNINESLFLKDGKNAS